MKPYIFATILIRFAAYALFVYGVIQGVGASLINAAVPLALKTVLSSPTIWQLQAMCALVLIVCAILLYTFSLPLGKLLAKGLD